MKIAKLLIGIVMMFLIVPIASAVDIAPILTLTGDYDAVTTSAVLTAVSVDVLDNAGVAWIKLYEDGVQIAKKDCSLLKTCTLVQVIVKTAPQNTFTYHAESLDKGGHVIESEDVVIRFAGVDQINPEYGLIEAIPPSPAPYGDHSFRVEWTDNGRIGDVSIEHNFFGPMVTVPVTSHVGDLYNYDLSNIELGDYQWRMIAEDVAEQGPNTNQTPWQDYTIVRADPQIVWNTVPIAPVDYGVQTSVGCALANPLVNDETDLYLYFGGVEVSNPHVAVNPVGDNTYTCNGSQTAHYNLVSEDYNATVNRIASVMDMYLNGVAADLVGVERLFDTVDITGNVITGEDGLELYIDGVNIVNGSSPFLYSTNFNLTGDYNVTLVAPQTQNYTESIVTFFVNVIDTIAPDTVTSLTKENATPSSITISWVNPTNDDFVGTLIDVDGINVANFTNETVYTIVGLLPNTTYNITVYTIDNDNNTNLTVIPGTNNLVTATAPDVTAPQWDNSGLQLFDWTYGNDGAGVIVVKISVGAAKLDTEIADINAQNLITVGNPCHNAVTAAIMGVDSSNCSTAIPADKAIIQMFENNGHAHLVVAGATDELTRVATLVLAGYKDYALSGTKAEVEGNMTAITVTSVEDDLSVSFDLEDYPFMFIDLDNKVLDTEMVVGASAPVSDVVGAVDIMSSLSFIELDFPRHPSIRWTDDVAVDSATVLFEHNFTGAFTNQTPDGNVSEMYFINMTDLPAGTYSWRSHANDTSGNSNTTDWFNFTISPAASNVELLINEQHQNVTILEGTSVDLNATLLSPASGEVAIYDGALELIRGPSPQAWNTILSPAGVYTISAVYNATANYSYSEDVLTVTVVPIVRNVSITSEVNKIAPRDVNITYTITITNLGNIADNYTVSFTNDNTADYADVTPLTFTNVSPSASVQAVLTIGDNDTGDYNVTIYVESDNDANANDTVVVTTTVADFSTVINSTVAGTYYAYDTTVLIPQLLASIIQDSTIDAASYVEVSTVNGSTLVSSQILDNSLIEDSTIGNSALTRCTVRNSTVNDTVSSDCTIIDSYVDPSNTTGSTITGDSNIIDSNVTWSTVDNSDITESDVNNSNVSDSTFMNSNVYDSDVANSDIMYSSVSNSDVDNSTISANANVADSTIDNSIVRNSSVDNSVVTNSFIEPTSDIDDSTITDSTVINSNVTNSTIINSTIPTETDVDDAWIEDGIIVNGTINGVYYTNTSLTDIVNYPPVAGISASSTAVKIGNTVTFTSTSSDPNMPGPLNDSWASFLWNFGDGSNSTSENASHSYSSAGTYTVTLTVTDSFGESDSTSVNIGVTTISTGGSTSSRSRSSSGPRIIVLNLTEGAFVTLNVIERDTIQFEFEGETQSLRVSDITLNYVDFLIRPLDETFTVNKYDTEHLNLNGDMLNDISVKVDEVVGNSVAVVTIGMKDRTEYDPIYIPEEQPEDESEPEAEPEEDEEEEEPGAWQKFVAWLKGLFKSEGDGAEPEPVEEPAGPAEPTPLLGWFLAFLIIALGVAGYFVARKKVMESRLERYLN